MELDPSVLNHQEAMDDSLILWLDSGWWGEVISLLGSMHSEIEAIAANAANTDTGTDYTQDRQDKIIQLVDNLNEATLLMLSWAQEGSKLNRENISVSEYWNLLRKIIDTGDEFDKDTTRYPNFHHYLGDKFQEPPVYSPEIINAMLKSAKNIVDRINESKDRIIFPLNGQMIAHRKNANNNR